MSAWVLTKGLLVCGDIIMYNGSHSFIAQLVSFSFKNKWQVFYYLSNCIFQMTYHVTPVNNGIVSYCYIENSI